MGWVEATWLIKQAGDGNIETSKRGKSLSVCSDHFTASLSCDSRVGCWIQVELHRRSVKGLNTILEVPHLKVSGSVTLGIIQQCDTISGGWRCNKLGDEHGVW